MVRTRSPRRLRKLERKGQRALETPRTHDGPPDRSFVPSRVILEIEPAILRETIVRPPR